MNYLKKFKESNSNDLSFDEFKEIMTNILDEYDFEYRFEDFTKHAGSEDDFYDCWISESIDIEDLPFNFGFLEEVLPHIDCDENFDPNEANTLIDGYIQSISNLERKIKSIIKMNTELKKILNELKRHESVFRSYNNCGNFGIGFEDNSDGYTYIKFDIRVIFDKEIK